jgi:DNA-binding NtrC family response regulator
VKTKDDGTETIEREPHALKLRSHKIRIEVVRGPDARTIVELPGPSARIGSGKDCDFVLTDPTVSRVHLRLRIEGDALRVVDEGSRNGTSIDGTAVRDAYARPDSLIYIGDSTLRLRMLSEVVELPLSPSDHFGRLKGRSVAMRQIFALLERVAPSDATVLIEGETGTGKELVARGLHDASPRAGEPFVVFDCSAVSSSLIESELFGHIKGSYTGAVADRAGAFEEANGGTLFLDEIGELPLEHQPKLLRALESREVRRLGANKPRHVDVRIVAATNRALAREVDRGRFREDLYYRLAVVQVRLPPLRERREDIPLLVRQIEAELSGGASAPPPLPDAVIRTFAAQTWPGNVRELRNAVDRIRSLGGPGHVPSPDAALPVALQVSLAIPLLVGRDHLAEAYEKAYIELALQQTGGNISRAAEIAGVGRNFLQKAIKRYGLRSGD